MSRYMSGRKFKPLKCKTTNLAFVPLLSPTNVHTHSLFLFVRDINTTSKCGTATQEGDVEAK